MISNLQFGRPVIEQMNRSWPYAAAAIGNHEFDWTADTLIRRIGELRFSALGANVRERKSGAGRTGPAPTRPWCGAAYASRIFGLCYPNTPSVTLPRYVPISASTTIRPPRPSDSGASQAGAEVVIGIGHIPP